jgi:penicillin-insensitive murein endopeptidase
MRYLLMVSISALLIAGPAGTSSSQAVSSKSETPAVRPADPSPATKASSEAAEPAKKLFGAVRTAAPLEARAIGFYARGCLAGAQALPVDGPAWQAMRLSRNRNWGHPNLVRLVERLATEAKKYDGWPGLLVGDMSQPRGGPMTSGHASHQVGLDADVWLTPMPDRRLTDKEREELSATSMLAADKLSVDPAIWTPQHLKLIKRAASYPEVERIFVHPAIKKALCEGAAEAGPDRSWLAKVRPYWGHYYHFHIRIDCPKESATCKPQPEPAHQDGCGKEVADWLALLAKPPKPEVPSKPKPPITLAQLPQECRAVLHAGSEASDAAGLPKPPAAAVSGQR